jgi:hypothetical protein
LVARDGSGRAGASADAVAPIPAGTRVHSADEHKISRKREGALSAADRHLPVFEGLPQHLKARRPEFQKLIQEQDTAMTECATMLLDKSVVD